MDIEQPAVAQLELALRLPIAVRGALMPDAHPGYALPIGGVFAAHRAVAPAMVGVDIGCRMHLSIFALPPEELLRRRAGLFADLQAITTFGAGAARPRPADHEILDGERWALVEYDAGAGRPEWCSTPHRGFVVAGSIRYEFEDGREPLALAAGQGFLLPAAPAHRGRNHGAETARLFVTDSAD